MIYAEDFDNVGLLVGDKNKQCKKVLIAHDASEAVIEEAVENDCQLVICFHPIIFKGLTSLTGKNYVERTVIKAIENKGCDLCDSHRFRQPQRWHQLSFREMPRVKKATRSNSTKKHTFTFKNICS